MGRKKSEIPTRSARIAEDVYKKAMIVAAHEGKDVARYMSDILRPVVEYSLLKYSERILREKQAKVRAPTKRA